VANPRQYIESIIELAVNIRDFIDTGALQDMESSTVDLMLSMLTEADFQVSTVLDMLEGKDIN
jgi:hypothetical protein